MRKARYVFVVLVAVAAILGTALSSDARSRGHFRSRVWIGAPFLLGAPLLWGYPYWRSHAYYDYGPPPVVIERQPPVYIQQEAPPQYWYYCQNPQGYYPHVQQCPEGWMQVVPNPQPGR